MIVDEAMALRKKGAWHEEALALAVICLLLGAALFAAPKDIKIEVICMGFQHEYWQTVRMGTEKAAKELGIVVPFRGPEVETEVDVQIGMFEDAMAKKVDGILLAPCDSEALVPLVDKATKQGIVVMTFDTDINKTDNRISFIATDNYAAGKLAGQNAGRLLGGKGKVGRAWATWPPRWTPANASAASWMSSRPSSRASSCWRPSTATATTQKSLDKATDMMTGQPGPGGHLRHQRGRRRRGGPRGRSRPRRSAR